MIQDNETNSTINSIINTINSGDSTDESTPDEASKSASNEEEETEAEVEAKPKEKVTIEFPYSHLLRSKAPKAFDVAEKVATDWKNEGDFTDLGIAHPVAGIVASQALQKAKVVEKKLEEKGVFSLAKMGLEIAKIQVENIKNKIQK